MKTIVFIENKEQLAHLQEHELPDITAVFLDDSIIPSKPSHTGGRWMARKSYLSDEALFDVNLGALRWLKEWSSKKICLGKNPKELFVNDNISLWWFMDFWLHYHELHKAATKEIVNAIEVIDAVVKKEAPDSMVILAKDTLFQNVVAQYCTAKGIPLVVKMGFAEQWKERTAKAKPYLVEFLKYRKFQVRRSASKLICSRGKAKAPVETVLCGLASQWGELANPATGEKKRGDAMLQPVIDLLQKKKIPFLVTDLDFTPTTGIEAMLEKRKTTVPLEYYMDRSCRRKAAQARKHVRAIFAAIRDDLVVSLDYKSVPLWPLLRDRFEFAVQHRLPEAVLFIEAYKKMLQATGAKSILIVDETGLPGRAAIIAGKMLQRKTIGLQHGYISTQSFEYMHLPGEVDAKGSIAVPYCPIPDVTAVYGEDFKSLLLDSGYPAESIAVTGQPRYDIIRECKKMFSREAVCNEFGIDHSKKIVMYITQPSKDRFLLAKKVFSVLAKVSSIQVVVKVHPRETGFEEYHLIAKEAGLNVKIIPHSLFKLLFACDAVVQRDSVVGLEAMMFGKQVICAYFIFTDVPEVDAYVKDNACRVATTDQELEMHLHEVLGGKDRAAWLARQERYLKKASFNLDGKSTERVVGLL